MRNSSENEPRRYLIAIGSPYCPNMGLPELIRVNSDIEQVNKLFTSETQGYERVLLDQIRPGAIAQKIKTALKDWFSSKERNPSDCVVVYCAGHGDVRGEFDNHYLFTIESDSEDLTNTAIKTADLVECFFPGSGNRKYPQNILLILDTCYAGAGGQQISGVLSGLKGKAPEGSGFWIMSSTDANSAAGDGDFVEALTSLMSLDHPIFQQDKDFLSMDAWVDAINQYFEAKSKSQRAFTNSSNVQTQAKFIRNPRFANLSSRFPATDRLLPLLEQIELERLNEAYRGCYPEWNSQSFPRSPKALLSALIHLPNGVDERLPKFIDLLRQDDSISMERRLVLQEWGSRDRPPELAQPALQTEFCLMVHVCESQFRDRYDVLAVLGQDAYNYTTLPVAEDENATFTDKQLPKVVAGLVNTCFERGVPLQKLTIQCFLPKNLLNVAIEQEELVINGATQVTATVCKSFLVRSLERQLERQKPGRKPDFVNGDWQNQWSKLIANLNASCKDVLVFWQADDDPFYEKLQDGTIVGCRFIGCANSLEHEELFDEIFLIGLPIAVWLRPDHAAADPCALLEGVLTGSTIEALPQSLTQKRKRARRIRASEQDKIVQHVALLWDNPSQPFPPSAYPET